MPFNLVHTAMDSGVQVLALSGTMTMGSELQSFESAVESLTKDQQNRIVVDMSQISYLDSSAIGVLVGCQGLVKTCGGQMRLAAVASRVKGVVVVLRGHSPIGMGYGVQPAAPAAVATARPTTRSAERQPPHTAAANAAQVRR